MSHIISRNAIIDAIRMKEQGANPDDPDTGYQLLFVKSDGVYTIDSSGNVTGPFGTGGGGSGDVVGPASSTNSNIALFDGITGKLLKDGAKGVPAGAIVGTTDSQTLTNKTLTTPVLTAPTLADFTNAGHDHLDTDDGGTLTAAALVLADDTVNNVATTRHGFAPKLPNDATKYLDGTGAYTVPAGGGGGDSPTHASLWHDESTVLVGNALTRAVDSLCLFGIQTYQNPGANADSFEQTFILAAGTYDFYAMGVIEADAGLVDWRVDGTLIATGQDWYSGASVRNTIKVAAGITIATDGLHTLTGTLNGKNGSSSGYYFVGTKYWFTEA